MKSVAIITGMLLLAGCVVAPAPVRVAPPIAVVAPPRVVYVRPAYPLPGPGYAWAYHPSYGWGWRHPAYAAGIAAGVNAGWAVRIFAEMSNSGLLPNSCAILLARRFRLNANSELTCDLENQRAAYAVQLLMKTKQPIFQ